ncbi:sensor histidine kinase [Pseudoduganella violacea]|uniref:histidine kinase n=1 Tax=Pseudoduganella violacea TaxID=1715466 RepID=A0A7W5BF01_9BURK|nr:sensor histidine kinase [Pseudoduganella violacea]MBB3121758.1 signal transduction histidine kinase [Pseudoduganella violacea]
MQPRLADFIRDNTEPILQAWEDFARTIEPPALTMSDAELRAHAHQILLAFATDIETPQSDEGRMVKSLGLGAHGQGESAAETHAQARLQSGYTVVQLVSEYRALRSSVLSLWRCDPGGNVAVDMADMTRFNEAVDQALTESVARYEHLVKKSQNMFLAILGHDLRNPLGTLVAGASYIMQAADTSPKCLRMATHMFQSAKRMSKLIGDLIDFTRTHLGPGIPVETTPGDLVAVCQQVLNEIRTFHPARFVELRAPPQLDATFDGDRIAQLLSNLIGNALQYGSDVFPVRVSITSRDDAVLIAVNNRGPVIPSDRISGIFDPMVRVGASASAGCTERNSLGIGLYISREIVHAHGGQISVASNATEGTTFNVTIPRRLPKKWALTDTIVSLPVFLSSE